MKVATGIGVLSGVGVGPWGCPVSVDASVEVLMAVGRPTPTVVDVSTGNRVMVGVGKGADVRVEEEKGFEIASHGTALNTPEGTRSGLKRANPTIAADNNSKDNNKAHKMRRPFLFLRRGLKTGMSSS